MTLIDDAKAELLRGKLLELLRRRYHGLSSRHEDLAHSALRDLIEYLKHRVELDLDDSELTALATTILKRRIADLLNYDQRWQEVEASPEEGADSPAALGSDQALSYLRVLRAVSLLLGEMDPYDRSLLLKDIEPAGDDRTSEAMEVSDRVRLSRLRKALRKALLDRFGISVEDELGGLN